MGGVCGRRGSWKNALSVMVWKSGEGELLEYLGVNGR